MISLAKKCKTNCMGTSRRKNVENQMIGYIMINCGEESTTMRTLTWQKMKPKTVGVLDETQKTCRRECQPSRVEEDPILVPGKWISLGCCQNGHVGIWIATGSRDFWWFSIDPYTYIVSHFEDDTSRFEKSLEKRNTKGQSLQERNPFSMPSW